MKEFIWNIINTFMPVSKAHSHRTQLASLASLNAPRGRDAIVTLRARSYILRMQTSLFLVIWYWSSSQFFNIVDVNHIFLKLIILFLISNEKGNSILDFP